MGKKWELCSSFFKIGLFTFGGGLAMIPLIEDEMVNRKKWITEDEMTDLIAIAEATPGVIAVNCATFVGRKVAGVLGGILATLSVVLPSFAIIMLITLFIEEFLAIEVVKYAFLGIRSAVAILILRAGLRMFKKSKKSLIFYILLLAGIVLSFVFPSVSVIWFLLGGGMLGLIYQLIFTRKVIKEDNHGNID